MHINVARLPILWFLKLFWSSIIEFTFVYIVIVSSSGGNYLIPAIYVMSIYLAIKFLRRQESLVNAKKILSAPVFSNLFLLKFRVSNGYPSPSETSYSSSYWINKPAYKPHNLLLLRSRWDIYLY